MNSKRPVNLDITTIKLPLPAYTSILHRISGILLFVGVGFLLYALEDEYFVEKKLYPNVDFYSGIILKALGIPTEMFTVIFATGRTPGWIAHWHEMISGEYRIGRPRQLYTGETSRDFIPVSDR